jgi:hypothetical protein
MENSVKGELSDLSIIENAAQRVKSCRFAGALNFSVSQRRLYSWL